MIASWGQYPKILGCKWQYFSKELKFNSQVLPFGLGRSYGDVCLNSLGLHLITTLNDSILEFNQDNEYVLVESGISLKRLLSFLAKRGFFLPVVPGTQNITVGGAIANDIHGKSHHHTGSFGNNTLEIILMRSDGEVLHLLKDEPLFKATVGGIGLTGIITHAKLKVLKIPGTKIRQKIIPVYDTSELLDLLSNESQNYPYTVVWLDLLRESFRGLLISGEFYPCSKAQRRCKFTWPFSFRVVNKLTTKILNEFYFWVNKILNYETIVDFQKFFFPLDSVHNWNKAYGKFGFMQWQAVFEKDKKIIEEIIRIIRKRNAVPSLVVLKDFGEIKPLGMLSFPKPGLTLAIDFPMSFESIKLVDHLNEFITDSGGKVYLAKDSRLKKGQFLKMYPEVENYVRFKDPCFCSDLWRRLT